MPKLRLAASVPAIDWKTRSTGAPASMRPSWVVTWARTRTGSGSRTGIRRSMSRRSAADGGGAIGRGIDPDDGVAAAVDEAIDDGGDDALGAVGG